MAFKLIQRNRVRNENRTYVHTGNVKMYIKLSEM